MNNVTSKGQKGSGIKKALVKHNMIVLMRCINMQEKLYLKYIEVIQNNGILNPTYFNLSEIINESPSKTKEAQILRFLPVY